MTVTELSRKPKAPNFRPRVNKIGKKSSGFYFFGYQSRSLTSIDFSVANAPVSSWRFDVW